MPRFHKVLSLTEGEKLIDRRRFLRWAGGIGSSLLLPGCYARSLPLKETSSPVLIQDQPFAGLATSLLGEYDYEAEIEGHLPRELRGTLYRNGPGLFDRGGLRKRSLLDGDGMVQAFRIHDRGVRFQNRFVQTQKYLDESAAGRFLYPTWSTQAPGGFWTNFLTANQLKSQAGITVAERNGRLYAFDESNLPYELVPETLETLGQSCLGLPEGFSIYASHWKIDPYNGDWLHFGVKYGSPPLLHITTFDKDGGLRNHRIVGMPRLVYMHDWIVSERHLIFLFHPAEIAFWGFLLGVRSIADSLRWKPEKGNLILILEREGDAEPIRLAEDACFMWHSANAYEQGNEVIADFVGYRNPDHFIGPDPFVSALMVGHQGEHSFPGEIRRYIIDLDKRRIRQEIREGGGYEWPFVNQQHRCHRYRYVYLARARAGEFFWSSITRADMETGKTENYDFEERVYCGEPVFVPQPGFRYLPLASEEPGWVLTEVYSGLTNKSSLAVFRADRVADGPIALVHLSHHVPFSFHGFWGA